ncbi:aminodeoxychorismate/anthranilate synthase component II [Microbacterium aquimaris]
MRPVGRILVVDNHDSFVHTLVGYLHELGTDTRLVEADELDPQRIQPLLDGVAATLISPGPGAPSRAGASIDVVRAAAVTGHPVLGVCLGHQAIAEAFGARVDHAPELMHGMTSPVRRTADATTLYDGLPAPFTAARYHSLAVVPETLPGDLVVTSETVEGTVMGIRHRRLPIEGVQFHPESVLTEGGYRLLANWLGTVGVDDAVARSRGRHP